MFVARVGAESKEVPYAAKKSGRGRDVKSPAGGSHWPGTSENAEGFRRRNAHGYGVHRNVAHGKVAANDENCGFGDPSLFAPVIDIPVLNDASFRIAQNGEWQTELATQGFGSFRRIHRDAGKGRAGRTDFLVMLAIIRQLAEAERSPRAAIEDEYQGVRRN